MSTNTTSTSTKHLDLGCGTKPRNPYRQQELYGLDIRAGLIEPGVKEIRAANLCIEPIPFESDSFDSLSAYDFLEHIPRVAVDFSNQKTHFPVINLMNEIWRVLKRDGMFYAVVPAYPHSLAFADPTHVNIMTEQTHRYFTGTNPMGRMYGFEGGFELVRQSLIHPRGDYQPASPSFKLALKMLADGIMGRRSHLLWELRTLK
jgi:SAM-dependent methyltransferase